MLLLSSLLALPLAAKALPASHPDPAIEKRDVNVGWDYGSETIRGVNIGGWLVTEPFITPSLYENTGNSSIVDEWTFCEGQDYDTAYAALKNHWDTWFTEDDFAKIASAGLNHVRIPIGYWAYDVEDGEPYISGQADYLDTAIEWARTYGLKVLIDLHAGPGSQNGYDNSGHRGDALWATDSNNVLRTKNVAATLAEKYSDSSYYGVVTMLALLNEPATYLNDELLSTTRQYWYDAYGATRYPFGNSDKSGLVIVLHDGFQDISTYDDFMNEPDYEDVFLDTHNYQVFNDEYVAWDWDEHLSGVCDKASTYSASALWLMVGEWSLATTDCAQWLNGRNIGSRYNGTYTDSTYVGSCVDKSNDVSLFSDEYKEFMHKYWDVQTQVYEANSQGWVHWTWKTENAADWGYEAGLDGGWIPYDITSHDTSLSTFCG